MSIKEVSEKPINIWAGIIITLCVSVMTTYIRTDDRWSRTDHQKYNESQEKDKQAFRNEVTNVLGSVVEKLDNVASTQKETVDVMQTVAFQLGEIRREHAEDRNKEK